MAETSEKTETFKAPFLLPSSLQVDEVLSPISDDNKPTSTPSDEKKSTVNKELVNVPFPYEEPEWGGLPPPNYNFEIIKNGTFVSTLPVKSSFLVFGRLNVCDVIFEHPSVSRYHAIVQYCKGDDTHPKGFYLYDLGSTHGTFINKNLVQSKIYYKLKIGYILKFGGSSRLHIFQGPEDDEEEKKDDKKPVESHADPEGCDWGIGEDAEEEEGDNSINPFALSTPNEDLYLDDPKKTLRGWFEREGYELEYDVQEKGFKSFVCTVRLPVDTPTGDFLPVEASVSGKKKEAVVACALEACRTLDRLGLLRQSHQESRQRKRKKWEENDFYDSDEDTFYDRTGEIEKRREMRKRLAKKVEVENFQTIEAKLKTLNAEIDEASKKLAACMPKKSKSDEDAEEDSLETFMSSLTESSGKVTDKFQKRKLMLRLAEAEKEKAHLEKLLDVARPTKLPPVGKHPGMIGKKPKSKLHIPLKSKPVPKLKMTDPPSQDDNIEEVESDTDKNDEEVVKNLSDLEKVQTDDCEVDKAGKKYGPDIRDSNVEEKNNTNKNGENQTNVLSTEKMETDIGSSDKAKKKYGLSLPGESDIKSCNSINVKDSNSVNLQYSSNSKTGITVEKSAVDEIGSGNLDISACTKKLSKKSRSRRPKEDIDVYKTDSADYTTWVPPSNQTGDGVTHLNAKYGY